MGKQISIVQSPQDEAELISNFQDLLALPKIFGNVEKDLGKLGQLSSAKQIIFQSEYSSLIGYNMLPCLGQEDSYLLRNWFGIEWIRTKQYEPGQYGTEGRFYYNDSIRYGETCSPDLLAVREDIRKRNNSLYAKIYRKIRANYRKVSYSKSYLRVGPCLVDLILNQEASLVSPRGKKIDLIFID